MSQLPMEPYARSETAAAPVASVAGGGIVFRPALMERLTGAARVTVLSAPAGRVILSWRVDEPTNVLTIRWREIGGPAARTPVQTGFGTRLIDMGLRQFGTVFRRYLDGGSIGDVRRWLSARLGRPYTHSGVHRILTRETYTGSRLFGKRVRGQHARLSDGETLGESQATTVLTIPDHAQGAVIGGGELWVARSDWSWGTLDRLDHETGAARRRYETAPGTEGLAFGSDGRLWAVSEAGSRHIYDYPFLGLFESFFPLVFALDLSRLR